MTARFGELANIKMESGLNEQLTPFVLIRVTGGLDDDHVVLLGQLSPAEIRTHATAYLEVAEAAESDAMVARFLVEELDQAIDVAAAMVGSLRKYRDSAFMPPRDK